jgi:hypothetical protein
MLIPELMAMMFHEIKHQKKKASQNNTKEELKIEDF